jgi:hypothetical protein
MRWTLAILFSFLMACTHPAYTLTRQGRTQILTPPPVKPEIKNARAHPGPKTGCDIESDSFLVDWHGKSARVSVKAETYYAPPETPAVQSGTLGVTISESGPRTFVDPLAQLEKFRQAVAAKQDVGCLRGEEGLRLEQAITERFPFPPQIAAYLRFGTYTQTGFIDLIPGFALRLVRPASQNPEVSFYAITRGGTDDRVQIGLASGPQQLPGVPETPAYYRYLYRTGASTHNFLATILGAAEREALRDATTQFLSDPETFCAKPSAGVFCQGVKAGMNAGFYVRANGAEVFVRLGGTLGEAIGESRNGMRALGPRQPLPQIQSFRRMFRGKLIPVKFDANEILSLVMMPGDEIVF